MNEILEKQWQVIKDSNESEKRAEWLRFCQLAIDLVKEEKITIAEASYNICGISAQVMSNMQPGDEEIMDISCNLELSVEQRSKSLGDWNVLVKKVTDLMNK